MWEGSGWYIVPLRADPHVVDPFTPLQAVLMATSHEVNQLEQLERLRSEDTPRRLMITHTIESYNTHIGSQVKIRQSQIFEFRNKLYTRHTFWSYLIRCANMKWIRWVLLKIQSGHDSVHRRTDRQGETSIPPFQLHWSGGYNEESFNSTQQNFIVTHAVFKTNGRPVFLATTIGLDQLNWILGK